MSSNSSKRKVPGALQKILKQDEKITEKFCLFMNKFLPFRQLRVHHKTLEITCHGIAWLAGWLAFIYLVHFPKFYEMQVNFFLGEFFKVLSNFCKLKYYLFIFLNYMK